MDLPVLYALAFMSSLVFVFLKAFQQLNVAHGSYPWVLPTSMSMAACEVYTVAAVAKQGWGWIVIPVGFGAGLGAMAAMLVHGRVVRRAA